MDRYTEKTKCCFKYDIKGFEHKIKEFNDYDAFYAYSIAVMKLGEYEDTDITPEQVATLKAENEKLKSLTSDIPLDRLEEICKAEKDGRCMILYQQPSKDSKCKPDCHLENGTQGYFCLGYLQSENDDEPLDICKNCWWLECNDDFREEAEAALKEGEKG